ncbi:MAG: V-type ATP synthase subunit D [Gammaproteobacteria bacterium HGW-Gammaproteobacteria-3]|nr:MAG: V-type ATP synthase subunit D [Gammaproteobacteria bacterium HGW-Gammaproteobacteria-3]
MSNLPVSKASQQKEAKKLKLYRQYLPSLDLKRQQLMLERAKVAGEFEATLERIEQCQKTVFESLPMLANHAIDLTNLVQVGRVSVGEENIVGIRVPILTSVEINLTPYSTYSRPHWVDQAVVQLKTMLELKLQLQIDEKRVAILERAVKKITQKVNLFDKVLIPGARQNIKKISIFLSDAERAGVVRAKITKNKRLNKGL